jgi:hypothetical protein
LGPQQKIRKDLLPNFFYFAPRNTLKIYVVMFRNASLTASSPDDAANSVANRTADSATSSPDLIVANVGSPSATLVAASPAVFPDSATSPQPDFVREKMAEDKDDDDESCDSGNTVGDNDNDNGRHVLQRHNKRQDHSDIIR